MSRIAGPSKVTGLINMLFFLPDVCRRARKDAAPQLSAAVGSALRFSFFRFAQFNAVTKWIIDNCPKPPGRILQR